MRSLVFSQNRMLQVYGSQFCCECNLCTLLACPEVLDPKNVCVQNKMEMREAKISYPEPVPNRGVHSMREGRQTPLTRLMRKLDLTQFENKGPLSHYLYEAERVVLPLRQHIGAPAVPQVKPGDRIQAGDIVADVEETQLGVPIHASLSGVVNSVTDTSIEIVQG
jgi:Na+-translocating ferredoxin:NAD+ oxidoreductase RnfC subunit